MNFGAVDGASLRSGYALPACRPVNGGFINRRTVHLSKPKRCLDKPGHLWHSTLNNASSVDNCDCDETTTIIFTR